MRPFIRGRGHMRGNFKNENSRGIQRGRGRGYDNGRGFQKGRGRGKNFKNLEQTDSYNNRGSDRTYETELGEHHNHRRESDYYEDDHRHDRNHADTHPEEGYYDEETRNNHDYDRGDYRSRCENDSFEYSEHDRYPRGELEYSRRDYDRVKENEYKRGDMHYREEKYDQDYFDKQDQYYPHGREYHEKDDYHQNYKDQYEEEKNRRLVDNRRNDFEDNRRHHDLQYNKSSRDESSLNYNRGNFLVEKTQHYDKKRFDGFAPKFNKETNNFRGRQFNNRKRGYHHDQKNHLDRKNNVDSMAKATYTSSGKSSDHNEKGPAASCDWPTNETGIKMAIEYLKNKPVFEKVNTTEEEEIDQTNLPVIDPMSLGKEAVEDLISDLLNLILTNGGETPIKILEKGFVKSVHHRFQNDTILKSFLEKYPKVFELDTEDCEGESVTKLEIVRAKTEVELCQAHSTHPKSCTNSECNALHICKFYILSSCEMTRCKFGHDLSDDHNISIQQKFYLHRVSLPNLCLLLQHDANRCIVTIPIICRYYNSILGCRSDEKKGNHQQQSPRCPFLHICQNFVESRCAVWSSCRRNHDLLKGNAHEILCKYGLDPRVLVDGHSRVLNLLRSSISSFKDKSPRTKIKSRYLPVQLRMNEESRLGLKRRVQVGGDDDISVKIQRVMDTSLISTNSQEQNMEDRNYGFDAVLPNKNALESGSVVENGSMINGDLNKNVNVASSALDQISKNSSINLVGDVAPSWSVFESSKWKELPLPALKDLEQKYQKYLASKCATVLLNGKYFKIDFSKLEGSYAGSSNILKVQRNVKKEVDGANIPENDNIDVGQLSKSLNKVEKDQVSFESIKDASFIKV